MRKNVFASFLFAVLCCFLSAAQAQDVDASVDSAPEAETAAPAKTTPDVYEIHSGDTMWDICKIVLDNPWYWPKLWSINDYIRNPNLIYRDW